MGQRAYGLALRLALLLVLLSTFLRGLVAPGARRTRSTFQCHGVEPPQEVASLELQLVDVAVLVGDRKVETRVLPGAVHPAGVDAGDAVLASPAPERHGSDRAAVEIGAHGHGFVEGFAAHLRNDRDDSDDRGNSDCRNNRDGP